MRDAAALAAWFTDNALNFAGHLAVAGTVAGLVFLVMGQRRLAVLALTASAACVGWVVWSHAKLVRPPSAPPPSAQAAGALRVMTYNVEGGWSGPEAKAAAIAAENPDILFIQEIWQGRASPLLPLLDRLFPYKAALRRPAAIIYARLPLDPAEAVVAQDPAIRGFRSAVRLDGRRIDLVNVQTSRPDGITKWRARNTQLQEIAAFAAEAPGAVIVAGDFNATALAPAFQTFLKTGGLTASAPGLPPSRTTWPGSLPGLGLQIDHILTAGPLELLSTRAGETAGSNHRALIATVRMKNP